MDESKTLIQNEQRIALKEKLHEARCREMKMKRLADEAALLCQFREEAYTNACENVRAVEVELERLTGKRWWQL